VRGVLDPTMVPTRASRQASTAKTQPPLEWSPVLHPATYTHNAAHVPHPTEAAHDDLDISQLGLGDFELGERSGDPNGQDIQMRDDTTMPDINKCP